MRASQEPDLDDFVERRSVQQLHGVVEWLAALSQSAKTDDIIRRAGATATPDLAQTLRAFTRMYRPHAAREETVLFPAFRGLVGRAAYRELGEQFEHKEHELFGEHGFGNTVAEVARLEAALAIADLARFTL